jgi:glycosyltransferase involved in cell wall biosynthesis
LVVPSSHLADALSSYRFEAIHLCENFLPGAASLSDELTVRDGPGVHVVWNSNILSSKGFFEVAEGVRQVTADGHMIRMTAVGAALGDAEMERETVEARLAELREAPWFEYLGPIEPARVVELVDRGDLVALPSRYASECQPLALIQAMCLGKEILITDTPALRATVGDYPAVVVAATEPSALARAMLLAGDRKASRDRLLRAAAIAARRRFCPGEFDRRMETILLGSGPIDLLEVAKSA